MEHLAPAVQPGQGLAGLLMAQPDPIGTPSRRQQRIDVLHQGIAPLTRHRRNGKAVFLTRDPVQKVFAGLFIEPVDLVQGLDDRYGAFRFYAHFRQHPHDIGGLGCRIRMGDVAHMHDKIGVHHLFQRRAEGRDKLMGQFGNESHRIGENDPTRHR